MLTSEKNESKSKSASQCASLCVLVLSASKFTYKCAPVRPSLCVGRRANKFTGLPSWFLCVAMVTPKHCPECCEKEPKYQSIQTCKNSSQGDPVGFGTTSSNVVSVMKNNNSGKYLKGHQ